MEAPTPIVVDLFCGAGGLSLGAARAGFSVKGGLDVNPQALTAHTKNFPKSSHWLADISELTGHYIKSSLQIEPGVTLGVIGGPPCQGFSSIGRRKQDDVRNHLFFEFFRLVREINPSFFLAENVPGILRPQNAAIVANSLSHVADKYHILEAITVSANAFGAPTTRTRVFFCGIQS